MCNYTALFSHGTGGVVGVCSFHILHLIGVHMLHWHWGELLLDLRNGHTHTHTYIHLTKKSNQSLLTWLDHINFGQLSCTVFFFCNYDLYRFLNYRQIICSLNFTAIVSLVSLTYLDSGSCSLQWWLIKEWACDWRVNLYLSLHMHREQVQWLVVLKEVQGEEEGNIVPFLYAVSWYRALWLSYLMK